MRTPEPEIEDDKSWAQFDLTKSWKPPSEAELALRREGRRKREEEHKDEMSKALGKALLQDSQAHNAVAQLARYDAALMNALTRSLKLLFVLRSADYACDLRLRRREPSSRPTARWRV